MKNKDLKIALIYTFISLLGMFFCHFAIQNYHIVSKYYLIKDVLFVLITGVVVYLLLHFKEIRHTKVFNKLIDSNAKIRESIERYDIVSKATSDTIWDWRIEEDFIIWNRGIEEVFGYDRSQVENNSSWWFDNIHPEDSIKMSIRLYEFLEQKTERWQDQYRLKCADGTYKYVLDRGFIVKDKNGKSIRMIGAIQDITKQKLEEQRLKLLETVITNTRNSIIITEPVSFDNTIPKLLYANPAFYTMTGYSNEEIIGTSPRFFNGKNSDNIEFEKLIAAIQTEKECEVETISYKKTNEEYWINFSMLPVFNEEEELTHWISIQRDITEDKKQEIEKEQLIRELTRNNKDLKQFSYITSHNLRAPLSNLTGLLNLLKDITIADPELNEILDGFTKSTHLLNETISDLVKVIVIKENPAVVKENININEVFENVLNQMDFLISRHKPIIYVNFEKASVLYTNKSYFESIILNLLTNSLKYKSDKHSLEIHITSDWQENNAVIVFKDNGIGIDLDRNKDKIFGLYQRFHSHTEGKGLGLYLVKSQVESMGGTINIESEVDKGTTFKITFNNN